MVTYMRIISGKCKGRKLKSVPGNTTRPTTDKIKERIFNIVGPYFTGGIGLDLFAGSGGLGLEALSRGLDQMIFVDRDKQSFQTIKFNITQCEMEDRSEVYRNDAERALKALVKRGIIFDYIFLDPPYKKKTFTNLLEMIEQGCLLTKLGTIICEHSSDIQLPDQLGKLKQIRSGHYGTSRLTFYQIKQQENEGEQK